MGSSKNFNMQSIQNFLFLQFPSDGFIKFIKLIVDLVIKNIKQTKKMIKENEIF